MLTVYFASPDNRLQCEAVRGHNVLLSFALVTPAIERYVHTFDGLLIDSGAYSVLNSANRNSPCSRPATKVDLGQYREFIARYVHRTDAFAGVDDITGNWQQSMKNYAALPQTFPTFHDTDPPELLDELIAMAWERNRWLGIGLKPPRQGKGRWISETLARIPDGIHVHGWAMRQYADVLRFNSMDSTDWFRTAMSMGTRATKLPWLTYGECLELIVKRYQRQGRNVLARDEETGMEVEQPSLFQQERRQ